MCYFLKLKTLFVSYAYSVQIMSLNVNLMLFRAVNTAFRISKEYEISKYVSKLFFKVTQACALCTT